jgi:hypothetical protein
MGPLEQPEQINQALLELVQKAGRDLAASATV